jgi:hypothetical protein
MTSSDTELFHRIGELLWPKRGWSLEPSPTPGGPSSWCYEHHGHVTASVGVDGGAVALYLPRHDQELSFGSIDDLEVWLTINQDSYK